MPLRYVVLFFFLFLIPFSLFPQVKNLPMNREFGLEMESEYQKIYLDSLGNYMLATHTSVRPVIESKGLMLTDYMNSNLSEQNEKVRKRWLGRKLRSESLVRAKDSSSGFCLTLDPLFHFEFGRDLRDTLEENLYVNTRGFLLRCDIGKKFSFESSFLENQAAFVQYIDSFNNRYKVVPGMGRWKGYKTNGYDFAMASGYISWSPSKKYNIQVGHGKHFIGEGYRSMFLSDIGFNYPYLRSTLTLGRIQYTNLYTLFMNLSNGDAKTPPYTERLFQKKPASFQFLSWNVIPKLQLGLFQGMIWTASDTLNRVKMGTAYFNPLILVNAPFLGFNDRKNMYAGISVKFKIKSVFSVYGQIVYDDFSRAGTVRNKVGSQIGMRYLHAFSVRDLHVQLELNSANPYTYAHADSAQAISHYNQPLAHPLGANFQEFLWFLNYRRGDFIFELRGTSATVGIDSAGFHMGQNIFNSDSNACYSISSTVNEPLQGLKTTIGHLGWHIGYFLNPAYNMNLVIGADYRHFTNVMGSKRTAYYFIAFRTSLYNSYRDW